MAKDGSAEKQQVVLEIDPHEAHSVESAFKGVAAAFFYGIISVSSAFVSKALMDTMEFDFPVCVMAAQMIFTISTLEILCVVGILDLPAYSIKRGLSFAAPAFFYGTNSVLALTALSHMNMAMYSVLKRCVPVFTLILSMVVLKKGFPSCSITCAVVTLTLGCVIASFGDLGFSVTAYVCGIGSNFTQALYLLLVQKYSERHVSVAETLQLNSFNTLPLLVLTATLNGELSSVMQYPHLSSVTFIAIFFLSISVGMLLNYSLFLCTSLTSALTTSVVGGLKAMVQTILGLFTFGGVSHNLSTYVGISMNLVGGMSYIWIKYVESQSRMSGLAALKHVMSFSSMEFRGNASDNNACSNLSNGGSRVYRQRTISAASEDSAS